MNNDMLVVGLNEVADTMHKHHGYAYTGGVRMLDDDYGYTVMGKFQEEAKEFIAAWKEGDTAKIALEAGDTITVLIGIMRQMGIDIDAVMGRILKANMAKEAVFDKVAGLSNLQLNKPEDWLPPNVADIVKVDNKGFNGIVMLEGADCTHKTTLGEKIARYYNGHYVHHTWTQEMEKFFVPYMQGSFSRILELSRDRVVVVDRGWITHVLYGEGYKQYKVKPEIQAFFEGILVNQHSITVFCVSQNKEEHAKVFLEADERFHGDRKSLVPDDETKEDKSKREKNEQTRRDVLVEKNAGINTAYCKLWDVGKEGMRMGKPASKWGDTYRYIVETDWDHQEKFIDDVMFNSPINQNQR